MYLCRLQKCVVSAKSESTTEHDKNGRKMKYKKIILGVALALACFSSQNANALTETKVKKTESSDRSTQRLLDRRLRKSNLYHQRYHFAGSEDCPQRVCGRHESRNRIRGEREIRCSDTDLPARPAHQQGVFGSRKTRCAAPSSSSPPRMLSTSERGKGRLIVIGSNARGTAYAIMKLSRTGWRFALWQDGTTCSLSTRQNLSTPVGTGVDRDSENRIQRTCPERKQVDESEELQSHRATDAAPESQHPLAGGRQARGCLQQGGGRQLRHLRGRKLQGDGIHGQEAQEEAQEDPGEREDDLRRQPDGDGECLRRACCSKCSTTGIIWRPRSEHREKSHRSEMHNDEDCAWIANVTNPKMVIAAACHDVRPGLEQRGAEGRHQQATCRTGSSSLFGNVAAKKIKPLMEEYYRLTSIRQPALYGNALRRYGVSFGRIRQRAGALSLRLRPVEGARLPIHRKHPACRSERRFLRDREISDLLWLPSSPKRSWRHRKQETSPVRDCSRMMMKPRLQRP